MPAQALFFTMNPMHRATLHSNPCIAVHLIRSHIKLTDVNAGDDTGATALHYAALARPSVATHCLNELLAAGAKPSARDRNGATPLHFAAWNPCADTACRLVERLVAYGADPNARDCTGSTPVHYAALHINKDVAKRVVATLTKLGADLSLTDDNGATVLHCAALAVRAPQAVHPVRAVHPRSTAARPAVSVISSRYVFGL